MSVDFIKSIKTLDQVLQEVKQYINHRLCVKETYVEHALGRVLAEDVYSRIDVPPFDRAVMDGFAVRSEDTLSASISSPVILKLVNKSKIESGEAKEIAAGEPLPEGADAVIMYEYSSVQEGYVYVFRPVSKYANVSRRGEDFKEGDLLFRKGKVLDKLDLAILIATGNFYVKTFKIRVGLACVGDEIVDPTPDLDTAKLKELNMSGKILNTTRYVIEHLLSDMGCEVTYVGTLPDDVKTIRETILASLSKFDILILTGGTAVSKRDVTHIAVQQLNPEYFHRGLAVRPGRPTSIAVIGGKPVILLSGFPVAAYLMCRYLVRKVIEHMIGTSLMVDDVHVRGVLTKRVSKPAGMRAYVRVHACFDKSSNIIRVEPVTARGSGLLSTLLYGNAILQVPEELEGFDENEIVDIDLISSLTYC